MEMEVGTKVQEDGKIGTVVKEDNDMYLVRYEDKTSKWVYPSKLTLLEGSETIFEELSVGEEPTSPFIHEDPPVSWFCCW